jgi:signal transduction histidine kinase
MSEKGPATAPSHIDALDVLVELLGGADDPTTPDAFYGRLCAAVCRLTEISRAAIFRYDGAQRRVRVVGAHGVALSVFADLHMNVESAAIARQALEADQVIEVAEPRTEELPAGYASLVGTDRLVCAPMRAADRWVGVILGGRPRDGGPLQAPERHLLWTLGKATALASVARIATSQAEKAQQLEHRIDLARQIHDGVVQRLFGVSLALGVTGDLSSAERERSAMEVHGALEELRSAMQQPLGRTPRPTGTTLASEVDRLSHEHPDLGVTLEAGEPGSVPEHLQALAQSVLIESIRNAHKHANPTRVGVTVSRTAGAFVLEVANDGVRGKLRPSGMGLRLAAMEALQVGGLIEYGPRDPGVWQVRLVVPDEQT